MKEIKLAGKPLPVSSISDLWQKFSSSFHSLTEESRRALVSSQLHRLDIFSGLDNLQG